MRIVRPIALSLLVLMTGVWGGFAMAGTNVSAGMVVISGGVFKPMFRSTADFKEVTVRARLC